MKTVLPLQLIAAGALLAACGPPELVAVPDNPYSNDDSDVVQSGPLTLVASRSTWYCSEGDMGDQVRRQLVPVIGKGEGVWSWVHIEDAAAATVAPAKGSSPCPAHQAVYLLQAER